MTKKVTRKTTLKTTLKTTRKTTRKTTKKTSQKTSRKTIRKVTRKVTRKTAQEKFQITEKMTLNEKLEQLYSTYEKKSKKTKDSGDWLVQTNWLFSVISDFDPKTGEALPQALSTFLVNIKKHEDEDDGILHDHLWRITEHARGPVKRLFRALNESPRREQALLHIRAVRELDANSYIKLSSRPGRTIREKLRDKPYLYAVRRFQSVDLPENRLLKEFVTCLAKLLKLRYDCLKEEEDELLPKIKSWLQGDEAKNIKRWENLPPNNTLLSHRDYRRILDAWRMLQTLDEYINDEYINKDKNKIKTRKKTMDLWRYYYGQKYSGGGFIFPDMPVHFNYKNFEIIPWNDPEPKDPESHQSKKNIIRDNKTKKILEPVCVDFSAVRPYYSCTSDISQENNGKKYSILDETYIWQHWEKEDKSFNLELFNSDALFLHRDTVTISASDLLYSKDKKIEHLHLAAGAFTSKLRETFTNNNFIWLIPDFLNYFELNITSSKINARFPKAEPLRRSVAAVFERIDYFHIKSDGYSVVVVDTAGGKTCATKLVARRFEQELKKSLPETFDYYWERRPSVIFPHDIPYEKQEKIYEIITFDENYIRKNKPQHKTPEYINDNTLENDNRIGHFDFRIDLCDSPVFGGIRYYDLQQRAGEIPLWRDNIPELKIKVLKEDGSFKDCILVSHNETTIIPIRDKAVPIKIEDDTFILPAGIDKYKFPLLQGDKEEEEVGYSAILNFSDSTLNENTIYLLKLTFTYGANIPYCLEFKPKNNDNLPTVVAEWKINENITEAPAPPYPPPLSWEGLIHWKDAQGKDVNLLIWLLESLTKLNEMTPNIKRFAMTISGWNENKNEKGELYWYADSNTADGECICYQKNFIDPFPENPKEAYPVGTKLFGTIKKRVDGKLYAIDISKKENIALSQETEQRLFYFREKSLQNRIPVIWADNRSLNDEDTPLEFKQKINDLISILTNRLPKNVLNNKFIPLLCCLHKDIIDEFITNWILQKAKDSQTKNIQIREDHIRAVGFALGDVSQVWQQNLLLELLSPPSVNSLRIFAYAIWHERNFINEFTISELNSILKVLKEMLDQIKPCPPKKDEKDKKTVRNWIRFTAEPLELLLGLLRARESQDKDIKKLLQPNEKITKELAKLVEKVIGICSISAQSNVKLTSRVQLIGLKKPESFSIPDLLYALRLYLTGDDGSNAIRLTVSDNDDENE